MLLGAIIIYLLLTIFVGYLASRRVKTSGDFMLAGRSLPISLSSAALFATWFGSETVFGASSEFLKGGLYAVIEDPFGACLCLVLFGLFFARKIYNMNLLTLGDFFKVRFGKRTELVASLFLAPPYVGYIAAQLVALGLIINVVTGIEIWHGVIISAAVVTFYTYIGGMWAISVTDFFQSIITVAGLLVVAIIMGGKAGGFAHVMETVPADSFRFLPHADFKEIILYLAAWSILGLGSIPSQDVFQRVMSSGSVSIAVRSCFIAAGLYLIIATLPLFISLCTRQLYPHAVNADPQLALPNMVLAHTGLPIQILFFGSLLSAIMSTCSSSILAPSAIFSENLMKPLFKEKISDKKLLLVTRLGVLLVAAVATIMACLRSNIYELVAESSIISLVSLFVPLVAGLYWKRASSTGALLSMILGIIAWIIFEVYETGWPSLVFGLIASALGMVIGTMLWPGKQHNKQAHGKN